MSDTDTRAALWSAIERYRIASMGAADRTEVDRAIAAHVEAEVARRLEAAPEVEAAIDAADRAAADRGGLGMRRWLQGGDGDAYESAQRSAFAASDRLRAAIAADKARAVAAALAEADQLSHFVNEVIRRVGARERGGGGQTVEAGTARLLSDAARRIDAMVERDRARPTPDEARRLVDRYDQATRHSYVTGGPEAQYTARTALLRALGAEA